MKDCMVFETKIGRKVLITRQSISFILQEKEYPGLYKIGIIGNPDYFFLVKYDGDLIKDFSAEIED